MSKKWQVELCVKLLLSSPRGMSSEKLKQDGLCYSAVIGWRDGHVPDSVLGPD